MSLNNVQLLLASDDNPALDTYKINNSLRLRKSATGYLNRTFGTPTSSTTWTVSLWVKRASSLNAHSHLFTTVLTDNFIRFSSGNLFSYAWANGSSVEGTAVYRDISGWYHLVVAVDTTQGTASNRIRMYVNGSEITYATSTYPSLNANTLFNTARAHYLSFTSNQFDGYVAEVNWIDGQQLTPSSFGAINTTTGVWRPKAYTGTYGNNGFYLPFSDTSALTTSSNAGLGKDFSGNGNYWTTNNISITSDDTYDAMIDSPTVTNSGTQPVGNYPTLNPLAMLSGTTSATFSNGNLQVTSVSSGDSVIPSTMSMTGTGKYYAEFTVGTASIYGDVGIINVTHPTSTAIGNTATSYNYRSSGVKGNNSTQTSYGASYTTNDIIGIAFDVGAGTIEFYKNNTSQGVAYTGISSSESYLFACGDELSTGTFTWTANFGQRPFSYTPPTGYKALCSSNLPDSTIYAGNQYMDATTYTGTGSAQSITNTYGFKPDLIWIKSRSAIGGHAWMDSNRGVSLQKSSSSGTTGEVTDTTQLTSFNTNGFSLGTGGGAGYPTNTNTNTYVAWQFQAGQGTTSSNTSGSITSTVQTNLSAGFSIVSYTGNATNSTIGHGLGVAPKMIICVNRTSTHDWKTYHASLGNTQYIYLSTTGGASTLSSVWNNTSPTSTVFSVGTDNDVNGSGNAHVAYCFAEIEGYSKFGSYTGNGSTDGTFVYTGFRPKYIMIKLSSTTGGGWQIVDTSRNSTNIANLILEASANTAEATYDFIDILSNGFKARTTRGDTNGSGNTLIYMAFAENPFKYALAR